MFSGYMEASYDLGANNFKTFMKVKFPLSMPGVLCGILMVFMPTVSTFAINDILGSSQYWLFGNEIYFWFQKGLYNIGSALAFVMLILILLSVLISNSLTKITNPNSKPNKSNGGVE